MECERIESFEPVPLFFQDPTALIFKIAGLHRVLANEQNARVVIELDAELAVPFSPKLDATLGERSVIFIRTISRSDRFADIGRGGERMRQGTRFDKRNLMAAFF